MVNAVSAMGGTLYLSKGWEGTKSYDEGRNENDALHFQEAGQLSLQPYVPFADAVAFAVSATAGSIRVGAADKPKFLILSRNAFNASPFSEMVFFT
ncbi:MAG: hypothetical protein JWM68_928 [Verrucomicrobiales bacterium]|nr:hypothetical protein [Verrucomicrobiales bacterium]